MSEEEYEEGGRSIAIPPAVYGIVSLIQTIALGIAGLAALYLLYGLFFGLGGFSTWEMAKRTVMLNNLSLAGKGLTAGFGVASVCAVLLFWDVEIAGYLLLLGAGIFYFGLPLAFSAFGGSDPSAGVAQALTAFPQAALIPAAMGGVLAIKDMIARFASALTGGRALDPAKMKFGANAELAQQKPVRTSLIGKCWEGSYCRDRVRPHCPIYQKRDACWKQRRGCYCENDIVSTAAGKVQGVQLEMAPASQYNYANPATQTRSNARPHALTPEQKVERCRNCVIYNDHQSEKYKVIMPITIVVTVALCALLAPAMRQGIGSGMSLIESLAGRLSFTETNNAVKLSRPSDNVQWVLVGSFSLMIVSKALQVVEWCIFTKKL